MRTVASLVDVLQAGVGLLILAGFWWAVFAVIRLFEPHPVVRRPPRGPSVPTSATTPSIPRPALPTASAQGGRQVPPCCPDCAPGCQITGLAMGQAWGHGDDWWGKPCGEHGANSEAMVLWGDECCPDCGQCPICQGS